LEGGHLGRQKETAAKIAGPTFLPLLVPKPSLETASSSKLSFDRFLLS
jgi:hypothetical protein